VVSDLKAEMELADVSRQPQVLAYSNLAFKFATTALAASADCGGLSLFE
jgi:hypothetical protein